MVEREAVGASERRASAVGRRGVGPTSIRVLGTLVVGGLLTLAGCSDDAGDAASTTRAPGAERPAPMPAPSSPSAPAAGAPAASAPRSEAELVEAGRGVYNANCIACHNMDPTQDGALGPAVAGASPALLEARVLRGEYPEGYVPKRNTRVMVPLPHLEPKLTELAAYLDSLD